MLYTRIYTWSLSTSAQNDNVYTAPDALMHTSLSYTYEHTSSK